jgi:hypothetical protein
MPPWDCQRSGIRSRVSFIRRSGVQKPGVSLKPLQNALLQFSSQLPGFQFRTASRRGCINFSVARFGHFMTDADPEEIDRCATTPLRVYIFHFGENFIETRQRQRAMVLPSVGKSPDVLIRSVRACAQR